ncbi:uroporphyrinogen-III C-methyltransferase [Staphylococcus sp. EG-SA-13]|nr:uroporphyrinogen-III C-methyltransferase [Staphylococcus sp. EG-SA-13]
MSIIAEPQVYLVGAGPGNPLLLSKKAERCIKRADVILYDQLVNPFVLQFSSPETEWIHVGKRPYHKSMKQEDINQLLVEKSRTNKTVVRLKGGDPAIFGRLAEEVSTLKSHNITFEVVPGITAASAAMSELNRGLTERNISTNITFTTGHFKDNEEQSIDITTLKNGGTLAIYMGVKRLPTLVKEIRAEITDDIPVAVIFSATRPEQTVISGNVSNIVDKVQSLSQIPGPGITIVGHVVRDLVEDISSKEEVEYVKFIGDRQNIIDNALEVYESGGWAIIDDRNHPNLHTTQHSILTELINQTTFTKVVDTEVVNV